MIDTILESLRDLEEDRNALKLLVEQFVALHWDAHTCHCKLCNAAREIFIRRGWKF